MNFPDDAGENDNDQNSSTDEDEETENIFPQSPSSLVEKFFFTTTHGALDISDDESDTENHYSPEYQFSRQNRLCKILRQSNHLLELKLNILHHHPSLRHARSDSEMFKVNDRASNERFPSSIRSRRLYLPSSSIHELQTQITNWLQASTCLIDSISPSTYHRRCWSQLLLTYFIERRLANLQFLLCPQSFSLGTVDHNSCSIHQYACIPEEDAYKLSSILQKGSRFNIDSNIFDHLRRIIVIKSMQETFNDNSNLQQLYVKQLTSLKQSLTNLDNNTTHVASIYSKVLLFLSSLYSIKAETMQTLFCQHLLHNPLYSYLITS